MKSRDHGTLALLPGAAVAFALALGPAQDAPAQDSAPEAAATISKADAPKQDKSVRTMRTGSNILRVRTDESLPVLGLDRAYIERSGATTAPELLRTVPQIQNVR